MSYIDDEKYEDFINYKIDIRSIDPKERTMNVKPNAPTPEVDSFTPDTDLFAALAVAADANGEPRIRDIGAEIGLEPIYVTTDEGDTAEELEFIKRNANLI